MTELDDHELLAEYARTKSEAAFAALVARYVNLVYSAALRFTGNPHHAEEITQAVFVILARKAGSLRRGTVLSGWLYQTARLTAANFVKGEIRRQNREQEAYMQSTLNEPDTMAWEQIAPLLDEAMGRLGETDRNAVVLRFFENKTAQEVAAKLKMNEAAAHKRVSRALEKLRSFFTKRGVVLSATLIAGAVTANSVQAAPFALATTITATTVSGSVVAASTLTLIKGTLKLMAWTKMKTAAVAGAIVLLAAGTGTVVVKMIHSARVASYPNIQGAWSGVVETKGAKLRLIFKLAKVNGSYQATLDSIDQGAKDFPVDKLVYNYPSFSVEMKSIGFVYEGKLNANTSEISGVWKQLGGSGPMVLKRTTEADAIPGPLAEADYAPREGSDVQGLWKGALKIKDISLRLNFRIAEQPDGTIRAEMDSVDQGAKNLLGTSGSYDKPTLKLGFDGLGATFQGDVGGGGKEITGTWTQGGKALPLTLNRGDATEEAQQDAGISYDHTSENDPQGHWKGTLDVKSVKLRLVLHIGKSPDGTLSCTMVSVDQGNANIPATSITWSKPNARIEWKAIGAVFDGKLEKGELSGTWRQGKGSFPLAFERSAK